MEKFDDSAPIYLQICDRIKGQIARGDLACGVKIKPVRELAADMGVNPNTVQKALSHMEGEGLLFAERTAGRFVTRDASVIERMKKEMLGEKIREFVRSLEALGYTGEEIVKLLEEQVRGENS